MAEWTIEIALYNIQRNILLTEKSISSGICFYK